MTSLVCVVFVCVCVTRGDGVVCLRLCERRVVGEVLCWFARLGAVNACVDCVMHVCVWWRALWRKRSLEYNTIGDAGAQHIATGLGRNTTLTSLEYVVFVCNAWPWRGVFEVVRDAHGR